MKLSGSIICITSAFFGMGVWLVHWAHSFLYLHNSAGIGDFQDGMFHKKKIQKLYKLRMDKWCFPVLY